MSVSFVYFLAELNREIIEETSTVLCELGYDAHRMHSRM